MDIFDSSQICRACLEPSKKLYPLVGAVVNVNVDIAEMISYCLCHKLEITDSLPNGVCIPCFRSIRISYNFFQQFNESQEKLKSYISKGNQIYDNMEKNKEAAFGEDSKDTRLEQIKDYLEKNDSEDSIGIDDINSDLEQINNCVDRNDLEDQIGINCINGNIEIINLDDVHESLNDDGENNETSSLRYVLNNIKTEESVPDSENVIIEEYFVTDESVEPQNAPVEKKEPEPLSVYYCPLCEKNFNRFNNFEAHLRSHDTKFIYCDKCPNSVKFSVSQYVRHYKEHHRYYCLICKKSLLSSYGFRYHKMQHTNDRKYACKYCPKTYFLYHLLKKHMLIHSDKFKHKCKLCGAEFKSYDTYRYHQVTHDGKRRFLCTLCGKGFYQSVHLRDHIYRHTGYKQFTCDTCKRAFTTKSQLKKHFNHCNGARKRKRNS